MIENFRKIAKNPIMKVLLLTLVIAFMLSGLSAGFLSQATDNYIAKVAGEKIYPSQIDTEYRNITRTLAERGMDTDENMLAMLGITRQNILNEMLQKKLILAEVDELGLTVSDDLLRKEITTSPEFQANGKFSSDAFKRYLYVLGLREHVYLDQLRKEISGSVLMNTLFSNIELPEKIAQIQLDMVGTKYDIELVKIPVDYVEIENPADDAALEVFLNTNASLFEREEIRTVSFFDLKKLDDARKSLEMATTIEDEIAGGATLEEIAKKHSATITQQQVTNNDNGEVAKKAQEISAGEIEIIEKEKSYSVIQLDEVKESYVPELAAIRNEVEQEWKEAEKEKLTREFAIELYEGITTEINQTDKEVASIPENLKKENIRKISAQELAQKGYFSLRGSNITEAKIGQPFALFQALDSSFAIATLKSKKIEKLEKREAEAYAESLQQTYANELQQNYLKYLADKHGVEFNKATQQQ